MGDKQKEDLKKDNIVKDKNKKNRINIGYFSYIKIIFVLCLVIGTIFIISHFIKKYLKIKGKLGEDASIISNQSLGPGKWIQIVHIAGKYLVLGITNDRINLLTEITDKKEIERFEIVMNERKTEEGNNFIDVVTDFFKDKLKKKPGKEKFDYEIDSVNFLKKQKERLNKLNDEKKG